MLTARMMNFEMSFSKRNHIKIIRFEVMFTNDFPKRPCTVTATLRPISVLPVNETSLIRSSSDIRWPTSLPP